MTCYTKRFIPWFSCNIAKVVFNIKCMLYNTPQPSWCKCSAAKAKTMQNIPKLTSWLKPSLTLPEAEPASARSSQLTTCHSELDLKVWDKASLVWTHLGYVQLCLNRLRGESLARLRCLVIKKGPRCLIPRALAQPFGCMLFYSSIYVTCSLSLLYGMSLAEQVFGPQRVHFRYLSNWICTESLFMDILVQIFIC